MCRCEEKIEKFHDHSLASSFPALHSQFKISLKKSLVRMDRLSIPTPNRSGFRDISRRGLKIVSPKSDPGLRGEISPSGSRQGWKKTVFLKKPVQWVLLVFTGFFGLGFFNLNVIDPY